MEMKRRGFVLLVVLVMVIGLAACGSAKKKEELPAVEEQTTEADREAASETVPEAEAGPEQESTEEEAQEPDSDLDNFDADMEEVSAFAALIKEAVAEMDLEKLADLTGFPVYVGLDGVDVVETREDFLKLDPQELFSEGLKSSIEKAYPQDLAPSMAGFTLMDYDMEGSASVTFGVVNGEFLITGINYGY